MLVDANILLYAWDENSRWHEGAVAWLTRCLNGRTRVGLPWESLCAFVRIATNPRAAERPLAPAEAWGYIRGWLAAGPAWIPQPVEGHDGILGALVDRHNIGGPLVSDAHLAAIAIGHGLTLYSTDTDFALFSELRWENPLA